MADAEGVPLPAAVEARAPSRSAGLRKRALSAVILLPAFLAIVMAGPVWLFGATVVLVAALGQWEFTGMFERAGVRTHRWLGLLGGSALTASFLLPASEREFTVILLAVLAAGLCRPRGQRIGWEPVVITVFGICYVNWLLGHGVWLRELPLGKEWVLLLVWVTWLGEAAAYLVGSTIGRHKVAPELSPRKTIEGAVAQVAVSIVAAVVGQAWFFGALSREDAVVVGALLGVVGQIGDLVESLLKRSVGTKDTGQLIPGHGGMLDRIDSLLFNTPVLFYYAAQGRVLGS
jgi:phosphatidate cytidylyltransferase